MYLTTQLVVAIAVSRKLIKLKLVVVSLLFSLQNSTRQHIWKTIDYNHKFSTLQNREDQCKHQPYPARLLPTNTPSFNQYLIPQTLYTGGALIFCGSTALVSYPLDFAPVFCLQIIPALHYTVSVHSPSLEGKEGLRIHPSHNMILPHNSSRSYNTRYSLECKSCSYTTFPWQPHSSVSCRLYPGSSPCLVRCSSHRLDSKRRPWHSRPLD